MTSAERETGAWWRARMDRIDGEYRTSLAAASRRFEERCDAVTKPISMPTRVPETQTPPDESPMPYLMPANLDVRTGVTVPTEDMDQTSSTSWLV